jgi:hypothetical protein
MNVLATENKQVERIDQLDKNFNKRQPTFRNYIRNNAQIHRTEAQAKKMMQMNLEEEQERLIQEKRSRQSSSSFASKINALKTYERIM